MSRGHGGSSFFLADCFLSILTFAPSSVRSGVLACLFLYVLDIFVFSAPCLKMCETSVITKVSSAWSVDSR